MWFPVNKFWRRHLLRDGVPLVWVAGSTEVLAVEGGEVDAVGLVGEQQHKQGQTGVTRCVSPGGGPELGASGPRVGQALRARLSKDPEASAGSACVAQRSNALWSGRFVVRRLMNAPVRPPRPWDSDSTVAPRRWHGTSRQSVSTACEITGETQRLV
jgi:hypothetical protein